MELMQFIDSVPFNVFMTLSVQISVIVIPLFGAIALVRN